MYKILFHLLMIYSVKFARKNINFIYLLIEVKMNRLKVIANDNIFLFDTKSRQLFFWGFSVSLKMIERGGSLPVKS